MNAVVAIVMTAGNMAGSLNSDAITAKHYETMAIQCVFTGSPVGTLSLQGSCDDSPSNWTSISGSSQSIGAAGDHAWNIANCGFRWLRVQFTRTSGSGSLNITSCSKG